MKGGPGLVQWAVGFTGGVEPIVNGACPEAWRGGLKVCLDEGSGAGQGRGKAVFLASQGGSAGAA